MKRSACGTIRRRWLRLRRSSWPDCLTVLIRQDRFVEGALASAFKSGLLTGIVRRAAAMVRAPDEEQLI